MSWLSLISLSKQMHDPAQRLNLGGKTVTPSCDLSGPLNRYAMQTTLAEMLNSMLVTRLLRYLLAACSHRRPRPFFPRPFPSLPFPLEFFFKNPEIGRAHV